MNGLSRTVKLVLRCYFFFFATAFFFAGAFFFALEAAFFAGAFFFAAAMCASLLSLVKSVWPLSSQALSSSATHHPYARSIGNKGAGSQLTNAILEIFF